MPFEFKQTRISDVLLITPKVFKDDRGFFAELYKESDFKAHGIQMPLTQVNFSCSSKNVLRGLHFQLNPKAQAKMVYVLEGEIFDVAVDIRRGSPTYGQWVGEYLSEENKNILYIPEGFAHGFCAMSKTVKMMYYCSQEYAPSHERNILWDDADIGVAWPTKEPLLSPKDAGGLRLRDMEHNFVYEERST